MLKIVENGQEAVEIIANLAEQSFMKDFQVGLTGSFVKGTHKKASSIDIVLKLKSEGEKHLVGNMALTNKILNFLGGYYHHKFNIMWLDLLAKDEEDIVSFIQEEGVEANPESVYTNVVEDLQWVLDEDEEDNDEDEDLEEEGDEIDG